MTAYIGLVWKRKDLGMLEVMAYTEIPGTIRGVKSRTCIEPKHVRTGIALLNLTGIK